MTRFDCTRVDELLMDFLYQELGREDEDAVRAHLDGCVRCAHTVRELSGVREAARELPRLEPSPALSARLMHQAALARQPSLWTRALEWLAPRRTYSLVAAAASLVVVLFVGYAMQQRHVRPVFDRAETTVAVAPEAAEPPATPAGAAPVVAAPQTAGTDVPSPTGRSSAAVTPTEMTTATPAPAAGQAPTLDRSMAAAPEGETRRGFMKDTFGTKEGGEFPVRLDGDSVRRDRAGGSVADERNVARVWDAVPQLKKGAGLGPGQPVPDTRSKDSKARALDFAAPPVARQAAGPQGHADKPAKVMAPNAEGHAGGGGVRQEEWLRPPSPTAKREAQASTPAPAAAPAPPAPNQAPSQAPSVARPVPTAPRAVGGQAQTGAVQAPTPRAQRQPAEQLEEDANALEEKAVRRSTAGKRGAGVAGAVVDDGVQYGSADGEYAAATKLPCSERAIKLLEQFVRLHAQDARVEAARLRAKVCRDQLSGRSDEMDQLILQQEAPAGSKQQLEAERQAPAKAARKPVATAQQRRAADKQQQRPAEKQQQAQKVDAGKKAKAKPAAKAADKPRPAADAATAK